jgi:hypothetical protein
MDRFIYPPEIRWRLLEITGAIMPGVPLAA